MQIKRQKSRRIVIILKDFGFFCLLEEHERRHLIIHFEN